jgi:hypothetical protein
MILLAVEKLLLLPFLVLVPLIPLIVGMLWLAYRLGKSARQRLILYFGGFFGTIVAGIPLPVWWNRHPWSDGNEFAVEVVMITLGCFAGMLLAWLLYRGRVNKVTEQP